MNIDFLMKFDVVIGNPPYQDSSHKSTTNSLWKRFLKLAIDLSKDTVSLVLPDIAVSPPNFSKIKHKVSFVSLDVKKHFPGVGSGFCRILMHSEDQEVTRVATSNGVIEFESGEMDYVPLSLDEKLIEQKNYFLTGSRDWFLTYEYESRKNIYSDNGQYEVLHTSSHKPKRTNVYHPNNDLIRVSVSASGHPKFMLVQGKGLSQSHYWTVFDSIKEAEEYVEWGNSNEVQSFLRRMKWGGMNSSFIIKNLR